MSANYQTEKLTTDLARSLKPGDVIENPYYMFWHPYVVDSVVRRSTEEPDDPTTVRVIHYGRRDLLEGISVLQENLTLESANVGSFRIYRFPEADCRPDDEVVELARERVGETAHRVWNNNATYFALSCKLTDEAFQRHTQTIARVRVYNPFAQA